MLHPALRRHGGAHVLGLGLVAFTAVLLAVPAARVAVNSLSARLLLESAIVVAMLGAALLLALLGRASTGRGLDAFVAALLVQVVVGALFAVVPALRGDPLTLERSFYPWLAGRYVAGLLLLLAAVKLRPASIPVTVGMSLVVIALVEAVIVTIDPVLPFTAMDRRAVSTEAGSYVLEAGPLIMFAIGSAAALRGWKISARPLERWLGLALLTGVATQVHEALFPAGLGATITSADLLRLLAAILLATGVVAQIARLQVQRDRAVMLLTSDLERSDAALAEVRAAREREAAFMSVVTHELTSPLAAINAHGHVLQHMADDRQRPHVEAMLAESTRLTGLVDRIDELRDIEHTDFAVEVRPIAVRPLLDEVAAFVEGLPGGNHAIIDAERSRVTADPIRLGQVLRNLVANAVRYTQDGSTIHVHGRVVEGDRYRITIADDGPGIAADDMGELFNPYVRGAAAGDGEGTGLGLHISRRIIDAHDGTIGFDRPTDPGTRIVLEIGLA